MLTVNAVEVEVETVTVTEDSAVFPLLSVTVRVTV